MTNEDWASIAKPIGLELLGEPKSETSTEVRWGSHGSWVLNIEKGQFYSFELDQGGGTMWLLKHFDQNINETLKRFGFGDEGGKSNDLLISPNNETPSSPSLTRDQFVELVGNKHQSKSSTLIALQCLDFLMGILGVTLNTHHSLSTETFGTTKDQRAYCHCM
jgi:hypothetical protein